MRRCTTVIESDLRSKHEKMKGDLFMFFRGTFYRWAQLWPAICTDLLHAPKVLGVGDLHVNSFGTWRDAEGRMAWGVDDFDEACPLPYTSDLVRIAASVKIVNDLGDLNISLKRGCELILQGYQSTLRAGGCPIVLAEHETTLERLGIEAIEPPEDFWEKLNQCRKLPFRRDRRGVELSGRIWLGGSHEAVAIYGKPDRGDSERSGCRLTDQRGVAQARD
jgi:hypothetical protein